MIDRNTRWLPLPLVLAATLPALAPQQPTPAQPAQPPTARQPTPDPFAASRIARDGGRFAMLLRQFRAEEPDLPPRHERGLQPAVARYQDARDVPAGHWVWSAPFWFVFRDGPGHQVPKRNWGPEALCGPPDTPQAGDHGSAWAALEENRAGEWLLLEYAEPVRATATLVHENFNPGAVAAVSILTPDGDEIEVWRAGDDGRVEVASRVLSIDLPLGFDVQRLRLWLRCDEVPGWNEIDAVGLRDDRGSVHWAHRATASTTYAEPDAPAVPAVAAPEPMILIDVVPQVVAPERPPAAAEVERLNERIAELEARVAELEAELRRARAGK